MPDACGVKVLPDLRLGHPLPRILLHRPERHREGGATEQARVGGGWEAGGKK